MTVSIAAQMCPSPIHPGTKTVYKASPRTSVLLAASEGSAGLRVLAKFSAAQGMKLTVKVEIAPEGGVSKQKIDETKKALGELGLQQELEFEQHD